MQLHLCVPLFFCRCQLAACRMDVRRTEAEEPWEQSAYTPHEVLFLLFLSHAGCMSDAAHTPLGGQRRLKRFTISLQFHVFFFRPAAALNQWRKLVCVFLCCVITVFQLKWQTYLTCLKKSVFDIHGDVWCHVILTLLQYCCLVISLFFKASNLRRWGPSFTVFQERVCESAFLRVWVEHDQTCPRALNGSTPKLPTPPRPQPPLPWNKRLFEPNFLKYFVRT